MISYIRTLLKILIDSKWYNCGLADKICLRGYIQFDLILSKKVAINIQDCIRDIHGKYSWNLFFLFFLTKAVNPSIVFEMLIRSKKSNKNPMNWNIDPSTKNEIVN